MTGRLGIGKHERERSPAIDLLQRPLPDLLDIVMPAHKEDKNADR
jgi:hypothetical protein